MSVDVYMIFNGNCREAVEFYAEAFETEQPHIMTFGDAPPESGISFTGRSKKFSYEQGLPSVEAMSCFLIIFPLHRLLWATI